MNAKQQKKRESHQREERAHPGINRERCKRYYYAHREERLAYLATGPGKEKAKIWNKAHRKERCGYVKKWAKNNPEKLKETKIRTYLKNREKCLARSRLWKLKNYDYVREYRRRTHRKYYQTKDGMLNTKMGVMIHKALRHNKAGRSWKTLVSFTLEELKNHLESQFKDGMNWERFMKGEIHIDHKTPKSKFKYDKPEDSGFRLCWSLDNLQPLWAKDNLEKHDKTMSEWLQWKKAV